MPTRWTLLTILCGLLTLSGAGCARKVNKDHPKLLVTTRISLRTDGGQGIGAAVTDRPGLSDNGRFVVYTSKAPNLVANDDNNASDVFYWDNLTRTTLCVSVTPGANGVPANGASGTPSISGDGRYVCFASRAKNITADASDFPLTQRQHIFVRDMVLGVTTLVDKSTGDDTGLKANQDSANPEISKDGHWVVFESSASNLDGDPGPATPSAPDDDAIVDIYLRNVDPAFSDAMHTTELVSIASDQFGGAKGNGDSTAPSISATGERIVFQSVATNLIPDSSVFGPDNGATTDIFMRDRVAHSTVRISVAHPSSVGFPHPDGPSLAPSISADGLIVAFVSLATNIDPADDGPLNDIFIRDLRPGPTFNTTFIASVHSSGAQAGNGCNFPRLSGDGALVTWQSPSPSLVNGDSNGPTTEDIFQHHVTDGTGITERLSIATYDTELNGKSLRPNISRDGRYVAFYTEATNAADDDSNGTSDFYLRGPPF
jgi:Tol biopolymer transport system component